MSTLRSFKRKLKPSKVWLAEQVALEKVKIARQVIIEQAKKDSVFAAEIIKAVGDKLPKDIKEVCEESVANNVKDTIQGKEITREEALEGLGDPSTWEESSKKVKEEFQSKPCCGGDCGCSHELTDDVNPIIAETKENFEPIVGGDTSHELTEAIQLDGGDVIMVRPEEVPGHSTDGEKIVMEPGPKLEKT